jgi:hypothetical protein
MVTIWRMAAVAAVALWVQSSFAQQPFAQQPECRLYKVQSGILNVSKEPRGDAPYIDVLDNADVVCVTRQQNTGGREWGFVDHKMLDQDRTRPVGGWANLGLMQPVAAAAAADRRDAPAAAPPAPAEQIVRFSEPLTTGPFPVNGQSLEQLVQGTPLFPPIEGLPESVWKKTCTSCHKWDRRTLCEQGASYVKNPAAALRGSHPYGGAEKLAMMQWAKTGCQ